MFDFDRIYAKKKRNTWQIFIISNSGIKHSFTSIHIDLQKSKRNIGICADVIGANTIDKIMFLKSSKKKMGKLTSYLFRASIVIQVLWIFIENQMQTIH